MKYSKQRELIKDTIKSQRVHLTADDVYAALKPENPNLSLGTVYRNLSALTQMGVIAKVSIPGGSDRFDGVVEEHCHVICTDCGAIFDVEELHFYDIDEKITALTNVKITSHQLIVNGVCRNCQ